MMAYESHLQQGAPTPAAPGASVAGTGTKASKTVTKKSNGIFELKTENLYLIPIAFAEVVILIAMIVMNYLFRFNEDVRDSSSLADYKHLALSAPDVLPARPYFDYSISMGDNQKNHNFGITFTMQEYAFFVPLFIFPLLLVMLVELIFLFYPKGNLKTVSSFDVNFNVFARRSMRIYYVFLFYGSLSGMMTSFIKLLVAKPRPHFLDVCVGDLIGLKVESSPYFFSVNATCTEENWHQIKEALRAFPSYHATLSFYAGTFLVLYLMYTVSLKGTYSIGGMVSLPVMVMATIGGLHRWCTYHADGWDIAWGAFIGVVGALWAVHRILNSFEERVWSVDLEEQVASTQSKPPPLSAAPSVKAGPVYPSPAYSADGDKVSMNSPGPGLYENARNPNRLRIQTQVATPPPRSPAQAFNSGFVSDAESPPVVGAPYNVPRQRYSVPAIQMRPMMSRPPFAHPSMGANMERRPLSRHEGASYF